MISWFNKGGCTNTTIKEGNELHVLKRFFIELSDRPGRNLAISTHLQIPKTNHFLSPQ